jgi:hypothetical protein
MHGGDGRLRLMRTNTATQAYQFRFANKDTVIHVHESGADVIIFASRDTFTEGQKLAFIRHLAAEGFICDAHQWCSAADGHIGCRVRWVIGAPPRAGCQEGSSRGRRAWARLRTRLTVFFGWLGLF